MEYVMLNNGIRMPMLSYGISNLTGEECVPCVSDALRAGHRSFDIAQHDKEVGEAVIRSGIPREELFLTVRIQPREHGYVSCREAVGSSMKKLQTEYLDLVLLPRQIPDDREAWRALEDMYEEGVLRAIGVSDHDTESLGNIVLHSRISPMVNQVQAHPLAQQAQTKKWMDQYEIRMGIDTPFGELDLSENRVLAVIGEKYEKIPAQVILRWHIQRGVSAVFRSARYDRMLQNRNIFDFRLSEKDMALIEAMNQSSERGGFLADEA